MVQPPPGQIEIAPHMDKDAEMQVEVQSALFNMLSGGTAGKGSNRSGKPNTPVASAAAAGHPTNGKSHDSVPTSPGKHDSVPVTISDKADNTKNHLKNGKLLLAQSADDGEEYEKLPSASRHPSGISSTTTTPLHAATSPQRFFSPDAFPARQSDDISGLQLHPKALANKNYGKASSFNKVFGSNHSMDADAGDETDCVSDSDKVADDATHELIRKNTALNSSSGAGDEEVKKYNSKRDILNSASTASEETFALNKNETLTDFDLQDSIEYDLGSIKFHSRSKSIKFDEAELVPEMTAEDEFGYDAYSSSTKKT